MNTAEKLSTGGKLSTAPFSASKKSGMKRENPPCTPYKRKARGKENNPGAISTGLSAGAYAGACERIRAREARRSADATPRGRKSSRSAALRASHKSPPHRRVAYATETMRFKVRLEVRRHWLLNSLRWGDSLMRRPSPTLKRVV